MQQAVQREHPGEVVIFVGDAANAARSLARALERVGYATRQAPLVRDVALEGGPPAAVIVCAAEGNDPFRVVRAVRSLGGLVSSLVFVWTPRSLDVPYARAIAFGADDVLTESESTDHAVDRVAGRIARSRTLRDRAMFDCTTHMRGRLYVRESLSDEIAHALRRHGNAAFAVLRLSGFAATRAARGLLAGESDVERAAFRLAAEVRPCDVACRVADDTFVVLLPGLRIGAAVAMLAPACARIEDKVPTSGGIVTGFAEAPRDGVTWEQLFACSERLLVTMGRRPRRRAADRAGGA